MREKERPRSQRTTEPLAARENGLPHSPRKAIGTTGPGRGPPAEGQAGRPPPRRDPGGRRGRAGVKSAGGAGGQVAWGWPVLGPPPGERTGPSSPAASAAAASASALSFNAESSRAGA